jgi:hypothetical protein
LTPMRPLVRVMMSLIWKSLSNSNMNSNKDYYNPPAVKKF